MTNEAQPSNQPDTQPAAQPSVPQDDPVTATARLMMQKAGVVLEKDDPELSVIDSETDDPAVFLESVRKAIEAKKQRTSRPTGSPAATPGTVATGSAPANLIQQYQREMLENRGKGMKVANDIKAKYRQKGVDVDNVRLAW